MPAYYDVGVKIKKMKLSEEKKINITLIILGIYIVMLPWITIFCRSQSDQVYIFYLFKDYVSLFSGNIDELFHIVGNILLFVPVGYYARLFLKKNCVITVFIGFGISLIIELIQLFTKLGCFEFDDLFHNSIGTFLGFLIYKKIPVTITFNLKKFILWTAIGVSTAFIVVFSAIKITDYITYQRQISFAAMGDSDDKKNLLIMECNDKTSSDGKISLTYQDDGNIRVIGMSDKDRCFRIGEITLEPGIYSFTGLSNADWKTIAIYLYYEDGGGTNYQMISNTVSNTFTLTSTTNIKTYVAVCKNYNCDIVARPVIYRVK